MTGGPLLEVRDLRVEFPTRRGPLCALDGVSFDIAGADTDDHLLPATRADSRWLGSIAIAIDGRVVGALDISGRGAEPDTIVAQAPPRGFGEGGA